MILIVTSRDDFTADYVIVRLKEDNIPYFRFNTEDLPTLIKGAVAFPQCSWQLKDELNRIYSSKGFDSVWYRRPKMAAVSPAIPTDYLPYIQEDSWFLVNGMLDLINETAVWISQPDKIRHAENKIYQLKVARDCGLRIPQTFIGNTPEELNKFIRAAEGSGARQFIAKPIRSGRYFLKNETRIFYTSKLPSDCHPEAVTGWPLIIQEQVPKKHDIRVTVFNKKVFSVAVRIDAPDSLEQLDWRRAISRAEYVPIALPDSIVDKLLLMLNVMGLSFGAFDLIETEDHEFIFLEINPNGQWAWIEEKTGLPMRDALINSLLGKMVGYGNG